MPTQLSWSYITENFSFYLNFIVYSLVDALFTSDNALVLGNILNNFDDLFIVSVYYDLIFYFNLFDFHWSNNFGVFFNSLNQVPLLSENSELLVYLDRYILESLAIYNSSLYSVFYNTNSFYLVNLLWTNLAIFFFSVYIFFFIKLFFFSNFFSVSNNENLIDLDYAVTTTIVEAEKEIAAIDDLIIILVTFLFIFGLYFAMYGLIQLLYFVGNFCMIFFLVPFFFFFVYVAPLCLLFDFGVYCFVYLRGTGPTSALLVELMYDLINLFAYYIRVCIQLARILLMLIAGGTLQEFIFYFGVYFNFFFFNESFFEDLYNLEFNYKTVTFFFLIKLPLYVLYWIYEIFHTYFVVTVQTIAFFAMLFWLFFYLFTFFFSESQEKYFKKKRQNYKVL